jgi:hypothetical protein
MVRKPKIVIDSIVEARIARFASFGRAAMDREHALTKRADDMLRELEQARGLGASLNDEPIALLLGYYSRPLRRIEAGSLVVAPEHRRKDLALLMASILVVWSYWLKVELIAVIDDDNSNMMLLLEHFGARVMERPLEVAGAAQLEESEFMAVFPEAAIRAARILTDPHYHRFFELRHRIWTNPKLREELFKLAIRPLPEDDDADEPER